MTFWDAGEFIAAAQGFGIPHPPGTPLYIALGRLWILAAGWSMGAARAMNLLSALATAAAGGITTWMLAREARSTLASAWGALSAGLVAGLMCSVWANGTETEVYAVSLLHVTLMLACALLAGDDARNRARTRWLLLTAYLIALAPALHLSALIAAPAAIALAARRPDRSWSAHRTLALLGILLVTAGIGRMSVLPIALGAALIVAAMLLRSPDEAQLAWAGLLLIPLAASALLILLVRARHDPALNQGNPVSFAALADVVARRQYAVAGLLPRQSPVWWQAANVAQYADWQVGMSWGRGVVTTPWRVLATVAYVALGIIGWRALRRDAERLALGLTVLLVCGSVGAAAYLNFKAGASLGWGVLPDSLPHEARERDYFFVTSFWAWGCFAGWGAWSLAGRVGRPQLAVLAALVPLVGNWSAVDRSRRPAAGAARDFAIALLTRSPRGAVLFTSGDNDSYPLWYLQQVEHVRPDVQLVTLPLLPASWYAEEIARRTGWHLDAAPKLAGLRWRHEATAAALAEAARRAGRPIAASPALSARERSLLGSDWTLRGPVFVATGRPTGRPVIPAVDIAAARAWIARAPAPPAREVGLPDDASATMLGLLQCPRLGMAWAGTPAGRDSLEVRCNFR